MKNWVSVIIPTYNSERTLERCLISIKNQSYQDIEIIVVDNSSKDTTKKIAKKYAQHVLNIGPERSAQRNYGAKYATGEFLLFIDSDMTLSSNVISDCVVAIKKMKAKMVVIPEKSFGSGFWADCKALERSFYLNVSWMEAARFFSKSTFQEFNGYDENNTGTEDYDLPQRILAKHGGNAQTRVNSFILHDEGNLSLLTTLKKKFYYAQNLTSYSVKEENKSHFSSQVSIFKRYSLFFSKPYLLFKNPLIGIGMLFMKTAEFCVGGFGYTRTLLKRL